MGTIIRLADWFGIEDIFCSQGTADVYNPKTIQATMGAIARVRVHYCDLVSLIGTQKNVPVYGTFLDGDNMYDKTLSANGRIVMGNETATAVHGVCCFTSVFHHTLNVVEQSSVALGQVTGFCRPVVHLGVDVDGELTAPRWSKVFAPDALQIARQSARTAGGNQ